MKTFAELREYAITQYQKIVSKQAEVNKAYQKLIDLNIYATDYLKKIKDEGETEVAKVRASVVADLEAAVKLTVTEKRTALNKMLADAPSVEQTNLLTALRIQGSEITPDEIKSIAVQLTGNYRALHSLQIIASQAGHNLHIPVSYDYQALTDALRWTEKYLHSAIDDLKNTTDYREMGLDSKVFFDVWGGKENGAPDDMNYKTYAIDILDGNEQTTPTVEPRKLTAQEQAIVESLFSDGLPSGDAMTQIMNSPELRALVSLHPKYKVLFSLLRKKVL